VSDGAPVPSECGGANEWWSLGVTCVASSISSRSVCACGGTASRPHALSNHCRPATGRRRTGEGRCGRSSCSTRAQSRPPRPRQRGEACRPRRAGVRGNQAAGPRRVQRGAEPVAALPRSLEHPEPWRHSLYHWHGAARTYERGRGVGRAALGRVRAGRDGRAVGGAAGGKAWACAGRVSERGGL
jgi:hypothetical protein